MQKKIIFPLSENFIIVCHFYLSISSDIELYYICKWSLCPQKNLQLRKSQFLSEPITNNNNINTNIYKDLIINKNKLSHLLQIPRRTMLFVFESTVLNHRLEYITVRIGSSSVKYIKNVQVSIKFSKTVFSDNTILCLGLIEIRTR